MANKQIIVTWLLLGTQGHWCDGSCAKGEFAIANSMCCAFCSPGWFVISNCTNERNVQSSMITDTECAECRNCGIDQRKVSNCTAFTDTVCENRAFPSTTPVTVTVTPWLVHVKPLPVIYKVSLYAVPSVVLLLILVAVVWKCCSAHRPSADPAREPFNIQKLRV